MPHISVKLYPGRTEEQKQRLAEAIVRDMLEIIDCEERTLSVSIEDVAPENWKAEVFDPEITAKAETLYKKPGYSI